MAKKNHIQMNADTNAEAEKKAKPEKAKKLTKINDALPKTLKSFSKAFAEYYRGFVL